MMREPRMTPHDPTLGRLVSDHSLTRNRRYLQHIWILIGFGGAAVTGLIAAWRWYFAYRHFGPALVGRWAAPALWICLVLMCLGLYGLSLWWRTRGLRLRVYENGIRFTQGRGGADFRWKQIRQIHTKVVRYGFLGLTWGRRTVLTLLMDDNRQLNLTHTLSGMDVLTKNIKRHVYPILLNEYRENLRYGHPVSFGPLVVTSHGIRQGQRQWEWGDLKQATLNHGVLRINTNAERRQADIRLSVEEVPNIDLCMQLIQHFSEIQRASPETN